MANWGLLGGIGEGLKQGIDSYRVERDYQLKKQQAADERALKERAVNAESVGALSKYGEEYGSYQLPQIKGFLGVNTDEKGLVPQTGEQISAQPTALGDQAKAGPDNTPFIPNRFQRGIMSNITEGNKSAPERGYKQVYDPKTNEVKNIDVPLSAKAQQERSLKQAELKEKALSPEFKTQEEYNKEKATQDIKETAFNYQKMLEATKHPSPISDKSLVYNYIRLENPGAVAREGSLEDLRDMPGLSNKAKNAMSMAVNGTMSDEMRNDLTRSAGSVYSAAREQHKLVQEKYQDLASERGIRSTFTKEPQLEKLDKLAVQSAKQVGPYKTTEQKGGAAGWVAGLLNKFSGNTSQSSTAGQQADPKIDQYAKVHNLDYKTAEGILKGRGYGQ